MFSEVLGEVAQKADRIAENTEIIKLQNDLERLDREWSMDREKYLVKDKDGRQSVATVAGSIVGCLFAAFFALIWLVATITSGIPCVAFFGVAVCGVIIVASARNIGKAREYRNAQEAFQAKRRLLQDELDGLREDEANRQAE